MFSMLSRSISSAISRYITFELGHGDIEKLKRIFSTSINIQIIIAIIILILSEIIAVWFLNTQMNIPETRIKAANWVLQCSIFTFIIDIVSIPYNASIIAHEQMKAFAYISILEACLKLLIVFMLDITPFDKLIVYGILVLTVSIIIRFVYGMYCKHHFKECTYNFIFDKLLMKEMMGFSAWNFIGTASAALKSQGVNIAINIFCGPTVNAARGLSMQVNTQVRNFASNFMMALNPQITKSYATGEFQYMMTLIFQGARLSFYLLLLLSLPIIIETNMILSLWLKNVPEHTILFTRLALIEAMIESISSPLITAMLATGKIRNYQIIVGGIQMLSFPLSYYLLYLGFFPEITMIAAIIISLACLAARLVMLKKMICLPIKLYLKKVIANITFVSCISTLIPFMTSFALSNNSLLNFCIICLVCITSTLLSILLVGCNKDERIFVLKKINSYIKNDSNK